MKTTEFFCCFCFVVSGARGGVGTYKYTESTNDTLRRHSRDLFSYSVGWQGLQPLAPLQQPSPAYATPPVRPSQVPRPAPRQTQSGHVPPPPANRQIHPDAGVPFISLPLAFLPNNMALETRQLTWVLSPTSSQPPCKPAFCLQKGG